MSMVGIGGTVPVDVRDADAAVNALTDALVRLEVEVRRVTVREIGFRVPFIRMRMGPLDPFTYLDVGQIVVEAGEIRYRAGLVRAVAKTILIWSALTVFAFFLGGPIDHFLAGAFALSSVVTLVWIYLYAAAALPRFIRKTIRED